MRRMLYTLLAGGLILFGFKKMMGRRRKRQLAINIQSIVRAFQKNRWLRKVMMEGFMKGLRRFQTAR